VGAKKRVKNENPEFDKLHEFVRPGVKFTSSLESGEQIGGVRDQCGQA
jgi:hypothetical protein